MKPRHRPPFAVALAVLLAGGGCAGDYSGMAVIDDEIVSAPRASPPVRNDLDFVLLEVDGRPAVRERVPFLIDAHPGVVAAPGTHAFRVSIAPVARPAAYVPKQAVFTATVAAGERYALVSRDGSPSLLEYRLP